MVLDPVRGFGRVKLIPLMTFSGSPRSKLAIASIAVLVAIAVLSKRSPQESSLLPHMPGVEDYTRQWWADGFPGHDDSRPWLRVFETGRFAFVLDTENLTVPHFGTIPEAPGYTETASTRSSLWKELPAAKLSLQLTVDRKTYEAAGGGEWTRHTGPRLVESGRFFQRSDVTDLKFVSDDNTPLNVEARLETTAWSDRLGLILSARPGPIAFPEGEPCFGKIGGGFGLDGENELEIPHREEFNSTSFTLDFWAFIPPEYSEATGASPWLVCKSLNENVDGNYGVLLSNGKATARINVGGGTENQFKIESPKPFEINAWNHFALSYDGSKFVFHQNGQAAGEQSIDKARTLEIRPLIFGRRADGHGDGRHFTGAIDEVQFYDKALTSQQIKHKFHHPEKGLPSLEPAAEWGFDTEGKSSQTRPLENWEQASMEVTFQSGDETISRRHLINDASSWESDWEEIGVSINPLVTDLAKPSPLSVGAIEKSNRSELPVEYDKTRSWHRINLDQIEPIVPDGKKEGIENDAIERIELTLANPTDEVQTARLLFAKSGRGFRQRIGFPITGISAILRDPSGQPTGIPVQLSKNWHNSDEAGPYSGTWFHGFSQLNLPAASSLKLELSIVYGHWGGLPAASHSQLSLIGWGSNQRWDESALGAWGESICYEPDQIQGEATVTDVRPLLLKSKGRGEKYAWTVNVGGADFFRWFDREDNRIPHQDMRATYDRQGPCLTDVTYSGQVTDGVEHSVTVSLGRTNDIVRGTYKLRLNVTKPADFSRIVIFQIGADTYSATGEKKMAIGDASGLLREWETQWGDNTYRTTPFELRGNLPWASLHDSVPRLKPGEKGAWPNRGFVIRSWKARLGGKEAAPWIAERGVKARGHNTSTMDLLPPPEVTRLERGDFIEATIEHLVLPKSAKDYYGPNEALRSALTKQGNSWKMVEREARGNNREVTVSKGKLIERYPAVKIKTTNERADFLLKGGLGFTPVTFTELSSPDGWSLLIDGTRLDQSVHGNDFWQTDYDPATETWSLTYNLPGNSETSQRIVLAPSKP